MAFQPFGYRFDMHSALSPDAAKAAIRARTKSWFDPKRGARGWVAGPFLCLWMSAFDRHGPMLFGIISRDQRGTRIAGRAGSDLNGVAMLVVLIPLMVFGCYQGLSSGEVGPKFLILIAIAISIALWAIWLSHEDRRTAEPLVRFLRDTVGKPEQHRPFIETVPMFPKAFTIEISGTVLDDPATPNSVREALLEIEGDGFVILSSTGEDYIQTVGEAGGYILEKRQGDDLHHYRAVRCGTSPERKSSIFTFDETLAAFLAYGSNTPLPSSMDWKLVRP